MSVEGRVDPFGRFYLTGAAKELFTINPYLAIWHECEDLNPCMKRLIISIPSSYVTAGSLPTAIFDVGRINLEATFAGTGPWIV
ncbi:Transthyretin-like family protein [Aphelenchoides fujianensis]|nr:Transthyretin-like family protein [Aphelenchoides fujianensis]